MSWSSNSGLRAHVQVGIFCLLANDTARARFQLIKHQLKASRERPCTEVREVLSREPCNVYHPVNDTHTHTHTFIPERIESLASAIPLHAITRVCSLFEKQTDVKAGMTW